MNEEHSQIDPILYREPDEDQRVIVNAIPDRAMNVEAASLALLENDDKTALDVYNKLSTIPRSHQPFFLTQEGEKRRREYDDYIRTGLVGVLGDPTVPVEQKRSIVSKAQNDSFAPPDSQSMLYSQGLISPSKGEKEVGSKVRESMAKTAFQAAEVLEERQGIINAAVGKRDGTLNQVTDLLSMLVPLESGITAAKVAGKSGDNAAKAFLLPGSYQKQLADKFKSLPFEEQNNFLKEMATIASSSSGLTTSKNQLRTEAWLSNITEGVGTGEAMFENFVNLLDIVGVGVTLKGVPKSFNAAKMSAKGIADRMKAEVSQNSAEWFDRTGRDIPIDSPAEFTFTPSTGIPKAVPTKDVVPEKISALQAKQQELTEFTKNVLNRDELEATRSDLEILKAQKPKLSSRATPAEVAQFSSDKISHGEQVAYLEQKLDNHYRAEDIVDNQLPEIQVQLNKLKESEELVPMASDPLAAAIDRAYNQSLMFTHNPRTPGFILNLTNPEKARAVHAQVMMNESDTLAQAIHGVSRSEALVKAVAPQVTDATGRVKKLVDDPEAGMRSLMASELGSAIKNTWDGFRYTDKELASARANVENGYKDAVGVQLNDAMSSFSYEGDRVKVSGVFTNGHGGWDNPDDAIAQAKFALSDRGITDSDIELLKLDGDEFVPVKKDSLNEKEGVFAVRVNAEHRITDADVTEWDSLDVKRNLLDRFQTQGAAAGWSRYLFEPNSMLHKRLTGPMSVADDKSTIITNVLLEKFKAFTDQYVKLDKPLKAEVDSYIREANVYELPLDPVALQARFPQPVIDMLRTWRDAWDTLHVLEGSQVVARLRKEGYRLFDHPNINAIVKATPKRYENNHVYDPARDSNVKLTQQEITDIYDKGGYVGVFRRPVQLNGDTMEYMIVRNTPTEYARALKDSDQILNYREGYYQVSYKTPKFIDETYTDSAGVQRTRTVGVAGSVQEAKQAVELLSKQGNGSTYKFRGDERDISRTADAYWDLNHTSGRLAQRHRGKLLEDTVGFKTYGADDFIENPADSAVRAATSMGGRMAMRDVIDTAKERWMKQFGELLSGPDFQKTFPTSRSQIVKKGESYTKELADARTTWEYINYMENGYINSMSEISKAGFNAIADAFGEKGWNRVEKMSRAIADANIQGGIKGGVFASYLASNPLRQWIVQTNQQWRMIGYSGVHYWKAFDYASGWAAGSKATQAQKDFMKFYDETGMAEAISRSNLIRGSLLDAANRQNPVSKVYEKGVQFGRSIGYDIGENLNNMMSAAAVWERSVRTGRDVNDAAVRAEVHAETRALTRNMSYAGDMPYNQNSLALAFTYMQVPHKFALQWADRTLSVADRRNIILADMAIWGVPGIPLMQHIAGYDILPENANVRDAVAEGLQSFLINKTLSKLYGEDVGVDFSSLAPYDMSGWSKIINGLMLEGGASSLIANAPAGNVLGLGAESRLGFALKTTAMFFKDLNSEDLTAVNARDVADSWARLSSGYSNFQEARIMYQLGKVVDKQGRITDDSVHGVEALAKVFGFGTRSTKQYYETLMTTSKEMKKIDDAAKKDVKTLSIMMRGLADGDMQGARAVALMSQALADASNFPSKQAHAQYIAKMQEEMQKTADYKIQEKLAQVAGFPNTSNYADLIRMSPMSEADRALYEETMNKNFQRWNEIEKANK